MTGYSKQFSKGDGDTINAADSTAEYNQLELAFAVAGGHSHDGSATEGKQVAAVSVTNVPITGISETNVQGAIDNVGGRMTTAESDIGTLETDLGILDGDVVKLTGAQVIDGTKTFNGIVAAASFTGPLTGDVTGNVSGDAGGNAATATDLEVDAIVETRGGVLHNLAAGNTGGAVTISTTAPTGTPANGDIWITYTP